MSRITRAAAVTAIAALALTGCASGTENGAGADSGDVSGEITYAFWDENQRAVIEEMVAAFEEENPDVDVTLSVLPWSQYWTTLQTQASSDSLPDVFWMNMPNFRLYASNGQLAAIDEDAIDVDAYPASLAEFFVEDGERYAVPKDADTTAVWVNKALFAQAGVELPAADWTSPRRSATRASTAAGTTRTASRCTTTPSIRPAGTSSPKTARSRAGTRPRRRRDSSSGST
jgi:multiple sugar transport system substrate-binding protein